LLLLESARSIEPSLKEPTLEGKEAEKKEDAQIEELDLFDLWNEAEEDEKDKEGDNGFGGDYEECGEDEEDDDECPQVLPLPSFSFLTFICTTIHLFLASDTFCLP